MSEYNDNPERVQILDAGEVLAKILIGRGERGFGTIAEMALSSRQSVIVGCNGYMGIIDLDSKKLYHFQKGSAISHASFDDIYRKVAKDLNLEWVPVKNTMFMGRGDDSAVIGLLNEYSVPETVQSVIDGRYSPRAGIVKIGQTEREHDASKFAAYFTGLSGALAKGLDARVNGIARIIPDLNDRIITPTDWEEVREVMATVPAGDMKNFAYYRSKLNHPEPTSFPRP